MFLIERSECDDDDVLMMFLVMMFLIERLECFDDDVFFWIERSKYDDDDIAAKVVSN